jgi:hypothetical protein
LAKSSKRERAHPEVADQPAAGRLANVAAVVLCVGWLCVPAVQYFGTFQRTALQVEGSAPYESLAGLDLTNGYLILVLLTALYGGWRYLLRQRESASLPHE